MTALLELGAGVGWPDGEAATAARAAADARTGRLGELVEWYASTTGAFPPQPPRRTRCLLLGPLTAAVTDLAAMLDVGVVPVHLADATAESFAAGSVAADDEIEAGADLLVLAGRDDTLAPAVLTAVLTDAEPVALLPRGADATDSARWIADAEQLRDARRLITPLRTRPDELLAALGSPVVAAAAGAAMRAAARRTPLVLDGTAVLAAALLCVESQSRARRWWQVADTAPDRVSARARDHLGLRPLLALDTRLGDGTAGLLAVAVLRAAVGTGPR